MVAKKVWSWVTVVKSGRSEVKNMKKCGRISFWVPFVYGSGYRGIVHQIVGKRREKVLRHVYQITTKIGLPRYTFLGLDHIRVYHQPNSCTNKAKIFHPHLHEQFDHPPAQPAINKFDTGFSDVYVRTVRTLHAHYPLSASHRLCNKLACIQNTRAPLRDPFRPHTPHFNKTTGSATMDNLQLVIYLVPKRTSCTLYCTLIQPTKTRHCNIHHQSNSSFTASPQILTTPHLTQPHGKSKKTGR